MTDTTAASQDQPQDQPSLLADLGGLADHLSPADLPNVSDGRILGALIKVLESEGLKVPAVDELLPDDHPARVQPPAPPAGAAPQQDVSGLHAVLSRLADRLDRLEGHQTSPADEAGTGSAGSTSAPSEPAGAPSASPPAAGEPGTGAAGFPPVYPPTVSAEQAAPEPGAES